MRRDVAIFVTFLLASLQVSRLGVATACPSQTINLQANYTKQFLQSPGYPSFYPRPASCNWKITALQGDIILLRFFHFDLLPSIFCYRDYFSVIDGHTSFHNEIINMCGSFSSEERFTTVEKTALVEFLALSTGPQRTGFVVGYWTEDTVNASVGEAHYSYVNYALMGISGVVAIAVCAFLIIMLRRYVNRKRKEQEDDEEKLLHRDK